MGNSKYKTARTKYKKYQNLSCVQKWRRNKQNGANSYGHVLSHVAVSVLSNRPDADAESSDDALMSGDDPNSACSSASDSEVSVIGVPVCIYL